MLLIDYIIYTYITVNAWRPVNVIFIHWFWNNVKNVDLVILYQPLLIELGILSY